MRVINKICFDETENPLNEKTSSLCPTCGNIFHLEVLKEHKKTCQFSEKSGRDSDATKAGSDSDSHLTRRSARLSTFLAEHKDNAFLPVKPEFAKDVHEPIKIKVEPDTDKCEGKEPTSETVTVNRFKTVPPPISEKDSFNKFPILTDLASIDESTNVTDKILDTELPPLIDSELATSNNYLPEISCLNEEHFREIKKFQLYQKLK
ncbi:hypothetical protein CEXT_420861 [Caerostris extrusa]|uniref:Uncharacterized protein n=1 Tax=Caerostris extrusa TaxID=172846 RepID=A0AAV4NY23_CAEEX|nr:hypothetical protein CEXT_420861 [Caerostris extrusa]